MALKPELEELLLTIKDETEREAQRKLLEKYPQFGEGHLRQSDYDRKMNEVKTDREKEAIALQTARDNAAKWQKWYEDNSPRHTQLMDEYKKVSERNKELEEQVKKAAEGAGGGGATGGGGGEVDETKLMSKVQEEISKRGYVSKDDVAKIVTEEAKKMAEEERKAFFKDTLPHVLEWNQKMMDFNYEHRQEFGEPFDRKAFSKFVAEKKIEDLDEAYKAFVGDKRTENKIKTETEKRVKDELSKRNIPGTGAAPTPSEMGPLQLRRNGKGPDGLPEDATLSAASMAAAAELRAEGKG
jgi:hypothetical protein